MSVGTPSNNLADATMRACYMRCVVAADGAPTGGDRAWEAFTGIDAAHLRAEGWEAVVHPDDVALLADAWRESLRTALPFEIDLRLRHVDGSYRWCQFSAEPGGTSDRVRGLGERPRWIVRIVDIHRHIVAQESLEQSLRVRGDSLARFAHDLRNPVQTMRHALFALTLDGASAESRPQMLSVLERQLELITRKTQDYLHELQHELHGAREP